MFQCLFLLFNGLLCFVILFLFVCLIKVMILSSSAMVLFPFRFYFVCFDSMNSSNFMDLLMPKAGELAYYFIV